MDLSGRPRFVDFESRLNQHFKVVAEDGTDAGRWQLLDCELLKTPPLEVLAGHECFILTFDAESRHWPQGTFRFSGPNGFETQLFATPGPHNRMQVTIN
jgi:hypothetical protein